MDTLNKKLSNISNKFSLLIIVFLGILASRTLLFQDGYFNMHDDLQMMRQLQLEKCILDGQIPCRWIADMGYGYGFPLFNFYPPLPYIIGQVFRFMGASYVVTAKYTFALAIITSGIAMYYFSKEFLGKIGGKLAAIFYIWAPYHAVDVYVRGAMNEAWALVWFPLILLFSYKIIVDSNEKSFSFSTSNKKWLVGLVLSYTALLLTHNLMVLIFTPVLGAWVLLHIVRTGKWKSLFTLFVSGVWSLGLAAFFTLPAVAENKFTQLESQLEGYYSFDAHFVSVRQLLFSRFWGYGPSVWLEEDRMSFQIGHVHWIISVIVGLILLVRLVSIVKKGKTHFWENLKKDNVLLVTVFLFFVGWFSAFMTHSKSIFMWKLIPQLRLTQFPWRFLTLTIFGLSFVVGSFPKLINVFEGTQTFVGRLLGKVGMTFVSFVLIAVVLILNWNYFLPEYGKMGALTDEQKFSGAAWDLQQTAGIYDYLPKTAEFAPREPMHQLGEFMEGEGNILREDQGTNWGEFVADVDSENAIVRVGIFDFPGWKVFVNGNEVNHYVPDTEEWGRMYVDLSAGENIVRAEFHDTDVRTIGNWITALSWIGLAGFIVGQKKEK